MTARCILCGDTGSVTLRHVRADYSQPCPECWGVSRQFPRAASASSPGGAVTAGPVAADGGAGLSPGEG